MEPSFCFFLIFSFLITSCQHNREANSTKRVEIRSMTLTSSAFSEGASIPRRYTCDDPDAPMGTWVHWVFFNLPADTRELPESVPAHQTLASGAKQGRNDFHKIGYGGPCPPSGTHRYYFKLYALDSELDLEPGITKDDLLDAMEGHILAMGQLMGRHTR